MQPYTYAVPLLVDLNLLWVPVHEAGDEGQDVALLKVGPRHETLPTLRDPGVRHRNVLVFIGIWQLRTRRKKKELIRIAAMIINSLI